MAAALPITGGTVETIKTYVVKDVKMIFTEENLADTTPITLTYKELFDLCTKKDTTSTSTEVSTTETTTLNRG